MTEYDKIFREIFGMVSTADCEKAFHSLVNSNLSSTEFEELWLIFIDIRERFVKTA